jgi:PmbA protein
MMQVPATESASVLPPQAQFEEMVARIIAAARARGASACEAGVSIETGLSVTVRLGEVETLEYHRDRGLGVTVYFDHRKGSASTSDFAPASIEETVRAACDIARYTGEDPCAGLAEPARMAREIPDLDLYHPWGVSAEQAVELARSCEEAARGVDSRITNSEGATVSTYDGLTVQANSHDFVGGYRSSRHSISCAVIGERDGQMQRDFWYSTARDAGDLEDAVAVGCKAGNRTLHRLGATRLKTRQAPVLFAAEIARSLLGSFVSAIRGASLYRQSSFLLDHLGRQVFPEFVHIHEQPLLKKAIGSAAFDNDGVATQARDLVRGGVLMSYVLDNYSACRLGLETTGNAGGVHNLTIEPGSLDLQGLLREMDTGLLVTELMGHGVNLVTGDYSRGAAGYWVESGEIRYPVDEITVAGNLRDMFRNMVMAGSDMDIRSNIRSGSLLIEQMTIAGE